MFHEWIANGSKKLVVVRPADSSDGTSVWESSDEFSGFAAPKFDSRIGTRSQQIVRKPIGVEIPHGTLVSVEGPDALSVFDSPDARNLILRCTEKQITIVVVFDDGNGTFVSL